MLKSIETDNFVFPLTFCYHERKTKWKGQKSNFGLILKFFNRSRAEMTKCKKLINFHSIEIWIFQLQFNLKLLKNDW